jgi:hypothetical protein
LERLYFCFQFSFVLFAALNGWTTSCLFWREIYSDFHCQEHSSFHSLSFNECSLFLLLRLAFVFSPWFLFRSCYIFASRCIWTSGLCWYSSKEFFQKGLNGVGKEKKFHVKKWYNRSLFRLRLRLLHAMLDIVLIVCLVFFAVAWLVSND